MGDVEADLERIKDCSRDLKRIKKAFDGTNLGDAYSRDTMGSQKVLDALDDFSTNWKTQRTKLVEELGVLADITKAAAQAYDEVDSKLAEALREQDEKHEGKKPK